MNFENKKTDNSYFDDMNIRTHLDTSLDLSGISVSEQLIQKTLRAIKEQPVGPSEQEDSSRHFKPIPWKRYVRSLTGAAAAVLILFAGYHFISSGFGASPKYSTNKSADTAPEEAAKNDTPSYFAAEGNPKSTDNTSDNMESKMDTTKEAEQDYKIKSANQKAEQDMETGTADEKAEQKFAREEASEEQTQDIAGASVAKDDMDQEAVGFHEVCSLTAELTESITITNELSQTALTLIKQVDIAEFYSLMEQYFYSSSEESLSKDLYYTIELDGNASSGISYHIQIGNVIIVEETSGETSHRTTYSMLNQEEFLGELSDYIDKY
ncbi:MAG: hypothetical protein E7255_04955 [Lachnospiraceae bacterium]|nr:hypothetical protein [Lachnospiraceae bacterium]